jgi:hypothetical protein
MKWYGWLEQFLRPIMIGRFSLEIRLVMSVDAPNEDDPHSRRILSDKTEWYDRLDQLAKMRQQGASAMPDPDGGEERTAKG